MARRNAVLRVTAAVFLLGLVNGQSTQNLSSALVDLVQDPEVVQKSIIYYITSPNTIRPFTPYPVTVTIQNSSSPVLVTVQLVRTAWNENDTVILEDNATIQPGATDKVVFQVQALGQANYILRVKGQDQTGNNFTDQSYSINVQRSNNLILVQTDKPLYKLGDAVKFRVLLLDLALKPVAVPFDVKIYDPQRNLIQQHLQVNGGNGSIRTDLPSGYFEEQVQLASEAPLGDWGIEISAPNEKTTRKGFSVEEYVLPRFDVQLKTPEYIIGLQDTFEITLNASYTFGQPVKGRAVIQVDGPKRWQWEIRKDIGLSKTFNISDFNGTAKLTIHAADVVNKTEDFNDWNSITVCANVTEGTTSVERKANVKTINLKRQAYRLDVVKTANTFKPGFPYTVTVTAVQHDGRPIPPTTRKLVAKISQSGSAFSGGDYFDEELKEFVVPANGSVDITIVPAKETRNIFFKARLGKVKASTNIGGFDSPSNSFMQIYPQSKNLTIRDTAVFMVNLTQPFAQLNYTVISKGQILVESSLPVDGTSAALSLPLNATFAPRSRLLVYYIRPDSEIVANVIDFEVSGLLQNNVTVTVRPENRTDYVEPGENAIIKVETAPNSFVAMLAMDQSLLLLKQGNDITESDVTGQYGDYDRDSWSFENAFGGSSFKFPDGRSVYRFLEQAGLTVLSNAAIPGNPKNPDVDDDRPTVQYGQYGLRGPGMQFDMMAASPAMAFMSPAESVGLRRRLSDDSEPAKVEPRVREDFRETFLHETFSSGWKTDIESLSSVSEIMANITKTQRITQGSTTMAGSSSGLRSSMAFAQSASESLFAVGFGSTSSGGTRSSHKSFSDKKQTATIEPRMRQDFRETFLYETFSSGQRSANRGKSAGMLFMSTPAMDMAMDSSVQSSGGSGGAAAHKKVSGSSQTAAIEPRIRQDFRETFLYETFSTGASGVYEFVRQVPDTITSWVCSAFSLNNEIGLGLTKQPPKLRVFRPFFAVLNLPFSIIRGETVQLEILVFNYLEQDQSVQVTLEVSGQDSKGNRFVASPRTKSVSVKSQDSISVTFPVKPEVVGEIEIKATAVSDLAGDSLVKKLKVRPEGVRQQFNAPLFIDLRKETSYSADVLIPLPNTTRVEGSEKLVFTAIGDLLGPTIYGINNLIRMPYGCGEQNMALLAPNVFVMKYLTSAGRMDEETRDRLLRDMRSGYQRQLTFKHYDGSYSAFGDTDKSGSTFLTAFVARIFFQAKEYVTIDTENIKRGLDWLTDKQADNGSFPEVGKVFDRELQGGAGKGTALTAYVLLTLIEAKSLGNYSENIVNATRYLESQLKFSEVMDDPYALSIVHFALQQAGSNNVEFTGQKLERLAVVANGTKHWEKELETETQTFGKFIWEYKLPAKNVEMTAYNLLSAVRKQDVEGGFPILAWLLSKRNDQGGFQTSQDTVVGLQAISEFAQLAETSNRDITVHVTAEDFKKDYSISDQNALVLQTAEPSKFYNHVHVEASGKGTALVQVSWIYYVRNTSGEQGFSVTTKVSKAKTDILLKICSKYLPKDQSNMAVMEIVMPSGYQVDEEEVKHLTGTIPDLSRVDVENDNTKVNLYFDKITKEERCVSFTGYRLYIVDNIQDSNVVLYDYYEPDKRQTVMFNPKTAQ